MTQIEWKIITQKVMFKHLSRSGYPNMTNDEIMKQVPYLWKVLIYYGLIPKNFAYADFYKAAVTEYFKASDKAEPKTRDVN